MNLDEFIANQKRLTQYGNPTVATDQAAKDILISINNNIDRIAKNWLWDWLYHPISITLTTGTEDYTLDADIQKVIDIYSGENNSLQNISLKEYHKYKKSTSDTSSGDPGWYFYIGRDSTTGARKIRIGNIPSSTTTLTGFGKLKLTRFTDSDLGTAHTFIPFPEDGEDVLAAFVLADIYRLQGKKELIFPQQSDAENKLKSWRGEETTEPANEATSSVPDYIRSKYASRRQGRVA